VEFLRIPDAYDDLLRTRFAPLREKIPDLRAAHVLADHDQWGYLLQSFTRAPHERGTLFFEIVQRQGSRRFDSADIRALYDVREAGRPAAG
jgi:4-hydroxymandelate synthase